MSESPTLEELAIDLGMTESDVRVMLAEMEMYVVCEHIADEEWREKVAQGS